MAAGAHRLLTFGAGADRNAAGTEIVLGERRLRSARIARDRPPLRGLAAPAALRPSDRIDAILALAAKALERDALDSSGVAGDENVAHDAVVVGADRAPVHEEAKLGLRGRAQLHLHQPLAIERRRRHQLLARLLQALLVRPLPVALDLRLRGADQKKAS